ncbi:unnamed protein product, partial [Discosporangium mesarthrocarpum]
LKGKHEEAEEVHRSVIATLERALGHSHKEVASGLNSLAGVMSDQQGKFREAETLCGKAIAILERVGGSESDLTL